MPQRTITRGKLLSLLTEEARQYRKNAVASITRNEHMNDLSHKDCLQLRKNRRRTQRILDALLVDFINAVGVGQCLDLALHTKHLKSKSDSRT